jgi:hypothetical protein
VPELYVRELAGCAQLKRIGHGETVLPGMTAHDAPGYTPGHLIFYLTGAERDVLFTGDAAKNRLELLTRQADMTYDASVTAASIETMWTLWRQRPGTLPVPGHDLPMVLEDGRTVFVGERQAAIESWFEDALEKTTRFEPVVCAGPPRRTREPPASLSSFRTCHSHLARAYGPPPRPANRAVDHTSGRRLRHMCACAGAAACVRVPAAQGHPDSGGSGESRCRWIKSLLPAPRPPRPRPRVRPSRRPDPGRRW